MWRTVSLAWSSIFVLGLVSCATTRQSDPAAFYGQWRKDVARGKKSALKDNVDEGVEVPRIETVSKDRVTRTTWVASQGRISWVWENGEWKIDGLPEFRIDNAEPLDAIRSFLLAIRYRRWEDVLRLLPSWISVRLTPKEVAEALDPDRPDVKRFMGAVSGALENPTLVHEGNTVYLYYDAHKRLELVKEEDGWHVQSPY